MPYNYGKQTRDIWGFFILSLVIVSRGLHFGGIFNKTIIPSALVGYEIGCGPRWLFTISYPTRAHGIIVKYTIYRNESALKTSTALYDLACLKALIMDLSTTDLMYQSLKILA